MGRPRRGGGAGLVRSRLLSPSLGVAWSAARCAAIDLLEVLPRRIDGALAVPKPAKLVHVLRRWPKLAASSVNLMIAIGLLRAVDTVLLHVLLLKHVRYCKAPDRRPAGATLSERRIYEMRRQMCIIKMEDGQPKTLAARRCVI